MELINSKMLQTFVENNKKEMEAIFPELIKRLIISSCKKISSIRFPSGDDVWAPGFDGQLDCEEQTTFINSGKSVWEFGTCANSLKKIESDFSKRNQTSLGVEKKNTSFYLVIPYVWAYNNKDGNAITKWESDHKGEWKTVKIYDAPIICDWINSEPVVCAWLFDKIKKDDFHDFSTVNSAWEKLKNYTNPPFSSSMFLSERESEISLFYENIKSPICIIKADTFVGARGFALAALLQNEELAQTCLVVNNEKTYKSLSSTVSNKTLFLNFRYTGEVIPGNNCILCMNREGITCNEEIELPMLTKSAYIKALADMKIEKGMCEELFAFTHGNLRTLIRRIRGSYIEEKPDWEKLESKDCLIPLVFMRALNRKEDARFAESITGRPFSEIEKQYISLLKLEDSPVKKVNDSYVIVNFEEAWEVMNLSESEYYFDKLTKAICEMFESISKKSTVFRPRALERRMSSLLLNYVYYSPCISNELMYETVCQLLAKLYEGGAKAALLENISVLAEACPKATLHFLKEDIKKENSIVMRCFNDTEYNMDYCCILRALEELMLVNETIVGAFKILIHLYDLNFNYSVSNKPEDSLLSSLCLWRTEGTSSLEQKKRLILSLLDKKEIHYASLALKLVTQDSFCVGVRLGERRVKGDPVHPDQLNSARNEIMDKAIDIAFEFCNGDLIKEMLDKFFYVTPHKILEYAERFDKDSFDIESIHKINYWAREKLFSIKRFNWKEYEAYIVPIDAWVKRTTDTDAVEASFWIFKSSYNCPALELLSFCDDYQVEDNAIREYQKKSLNLLLQKFGLDVLGKIINYMDDSSSWGRLIAEETDENDFDYCAKIIALEHKTKILCEYLDCTKTENAINYIFSCEKEERHSLLSGIRNPLIVSELKDEDDVKAYWKTKQMFRYDEDEFCSLLKYYPENLLWFLSINIGQNPNQFIDMTEAVFSALIDNKKILLRRDYKDDVEQIMKAIDAVYYSDDWANICINMFINEYVDSLSESARKYMFEHPVEIKKMLDEYKMSSFRVLNAFKLPECAYSDYSGFRFFILELKKIINDEKWYFVGSILGKAQKGSDGWFPHEFIRNILEEIDNTDLDLHVMVAFQNARSFRIVSDGSDQKAIMKEYRNKAIDLEICYPHTSSILRMISEEYEMNAKRDFESSEIDIF